MKANVYDSGDWDDFWDDIIDIVYVQSSHSSYCQDEAGLNDPGSAVFQEEGVMSNTVSDVFSRIKLGPYGIKCRIRIIDLLERSGIGTIEQLVAMTESELLQIKYLGRKSLNTISDFLDHFGLSLKPDLDKIGKRIKRIKMLYRMMDEAGITARELAAGMFISGELNFNPDLVRLIESDGFRRDPDYD